MGDSFQEEEAAEVAEDDSRLVQAASRLSEDALRKIWDNADNTDYDRL
jgi:hypothetical protein